MREPSVKANDEVAFGDQIYRCLRVDEFKRRDGREGALATFTTYCALCGEPFEFSMSGYFTAGTFRPVTTCSKHRQQPAEPEPEEEDTTRKSETVVSDQKS